MNASNLIDFRLPIELGGRTFSVGRIRLSTVLRILVRFDEQLVEFVSQEKPDAIALFESLDRDDTADLLAFLMEPHDPAFVRAHLDLVATSQISVAFGHLNDVGRIWSALKLAPPASTDDRSEIAPAPDVKPQVPIDALVVAIDRLAQRYGIDPTTIPGWCFEAFLDFSEVCDADADALAEALKHGIVWKDGSGLDPDTLDDSRISPGPIPDLNTVN